jgi:hypothetical protein
MTSSVRVFAKSLHWLAAGWVIGIVWLCIAQIRHGWLLDPLTPTNFHIDTLIEGILPALVVEMTALLAAAWTGAAPTPAIEWREWEIAFVWSLLPNLLVLYTVHLMVVGDI